MKRFFISVVLITFSFAVFSQPVPETIKFINPINPADSNSFGISYSTLSYFRDYEYFKNKIQTGYTHFGTWHYPRLVIQPSPKLRLEAGALVQKEFGDRETRAHVMFSVQFMPQKNTRIIFGALEGSVSHNLVQPLMGWDRVIERPIEEGFQVRHNSKRIDADIWIDWSVRQSVNSNFPEELTGGLSFAYKLSKPGNAWQLKIPLRVVLPHQGGQLDTNGSVVTTVMNTAAGLSAEWTSNAKEKFIKHFSADAYHVGFKHFHKSNLYPFEQGRGLLVNVQAKSKIDVGLLLTYWNGNNYIAPMGAPLYQSISSILPRYNSYTEKERSLLFINLFYEKELFKNFYTYASVYPNIDLKNGYFEHSFMVMLSYRNFFQLLTLKNQKTVK